MSVEKHIQSLNLGCLEHYIEQCTDCGSTIQQCKCMSAQKNMFYTICVDCLKERQEESEAICLKECNYE